jgi:hypothetical protein
VVHQGQVVPVVEHQDHPGAPETSDSWKAGSSGVNGTS